MIQRQRKKILLFCLLTIFVICCIFWLSSFNCFNLERTFSEIKSSIDYSKRSNELIVNDPFIFIGGIPRSGTTLMRAMLDAHPDVRCGEETRVIPRILALRSQWKKSEKEWRRLQEAGVNENVINSAISSFIVNIIIGHGDPAPRLCNKDPFTLKSTVYLSELFPKAKFIFMIRDGRATVHSIISRKITITGFDLNDFKQCLQRWNTGIEVMNEQCKQVGDKKCIQKKKKKLVLHPEKEMRKILDFLNLPWNISVLHHEMFIGNKISLSKTERSTDQVIKPVNLDALSKWVGKIPEDVVNQMDEIAPMLKVLGYDPNANPPNYGQADEFVRIKTEQIHKDEQKWYDKAKDMVIDPDRIQRPKQEIKASINNITIMAG
ncbi:Protein-tyrosine sulfotransferase [Meloidogyne graminicola]|uniref:Protein-tyrosine sulfotransferase n=1 Tax=Meloidogyne graminicola TaxID=189291 RepID=A0A8S9ZTT5_9BILA|nr:Protein-tyrosine sulfotransferase [Meloidogyne graminicola]